MALPKACDLVVVGGGGSGLTAAVVAARAGAKVVLLEKEPSVGGTTRLAIGSITAACTPWQRQKGMQDNFDDFEADMGKFTGKWLDRDNPVLRRILAREAVQTLIWLREVGLSFIGPFPEPPHRVPRMHNVVPAARTYIAALHKQALLEGVQVVTSSPVLGLIREEGQVIGVKVGQEGREVQVSARLGVVLATGDYSNSKEFKARFIRPDAAAVPGINEASTGDGHRMGLESGGDLVNMDIAYGPEIRFPPPPSPSWIDRVPNNLALTRFLGFLGNHLPHSFFRLVAKQLLTTRMAPSPRLFSEGAILVNGNGNRFADEVDEPAYGLARQPDMKAYIILDSRVASAFSGGELYISTAPGLAYAYWTDYQRGRPDLIREGRTPGELAARLEMDPKALEATVASYNTESSMNGRSPLATGPYFSLGPVTPMFITTEGGLLVNENCQVATPTGHPIPGLWAVGSTGQGGLVLAGHGLHILWAITSGRIAGQSVANQICTEGSVRNASIPRSQVAGSVR